MGHIKQTNNPSEFSKLSSHTYLFSARADRLATLYLFHPLRMIHAQRKIRVPVLMYHSISEHNERGVHPYYQTTTCPRLFAQQMHFLYEHQYSVINLKTLAHSLREGNHLEKSVAITFDDGFRDFYTQAFPIMSRYGFRPAVFLPTGYIGDTVYQFKGRDCLTWKEVRELHGAGVSFGSHTVSHPQLQFVSRKQQDDELRQSKEIIENKIGTPIQSFAYPFAFPEDDREFVRQLRHNLQDSGYENGVSTMVGTVGPADDRYFLKRLPVNSWDDLSLFKAKLEGGYDWLHGIQCASKFIRSGVEQWRSVKAGTTSSSRL